MFTSFVPTWHGRGLFLPPLLSPSPRAVVTRADSIAGPIGSVVETTEGDPAMNTCRSVLMHDLRVLASPMTEPRLGGSGKETVGGPKGPAGLAALGERKRSAVPSCQVVNQQASSRGFGNQAISASAYVVRVCLLWPHPRPLARASRVGRRRYEQIHCRRTRP